MIVHAANPIYDSIFKYLVEDKRIAKILISALLKKEVLDVEFRRHEYTNNVRNDISMFRKPFFSIAMGNGRDELKAHADYVTGDNDKGGILKACKKFGWL